MLTYAFLNLARHLINCEEIYRKCFLMLVESLDLYFGFDFFSRPKQVVLIRGSITVPHNNIKVIVEG